MKVEEITNREQDEYSEMLTLTYYRCSDGQEFNHLEIATEHEKEINVKARHRGELPKTIQCFLATNGNCSPHVESDHKDWCSLFYSYRNYQQQLTQETNWQNLAKHIWGDGLTSSEDLCAKLKQVNLFSVYPCGGMPTGDPVYF